MSNLEHLVENGLTAFDRGFRYHEWLKQMRKDPNWEGVERLTIDDLWEICQYVYYSWMPCREDELQTEYERASEQREHDILYEPTYNPEDGSM